ATEGAVILTPHRGRHVQMLESTDLLVGSDQRQIEFPIREPDTFAAPEAIGPRDMVVNAKLVLSVADAGRKTCITPGQREQGPFGAKLITTAFVAVAGVEDGCRASGDHGLQPVLMVLAAAGRCTERQRPVIRQPDLQA